MTRVVAVFWLTDAARGVREGFFMFWETLWALVLGFTLSGFVQAFVSRRSMRRALGDHRPAAVLRASGYGMVSSSCSYAAAAMARALFAKGADFVSALVFMFASTNLVVELGIVMLALLGWQFAVAEFVGGPIMIVLLVLGGSVVFGAAVVAGARARVRRDTEARAGHDHDHGHDQDDDHDHGDDAAGAGTEVPWRVKARSLAAWSDAAGFSVADATMLRRELLVGYLAAGLLAVLVPGAAWSALFVHGHGLSTQVENAFVGPLIAVISWVCSIGNVPLAAALWKGGISFGGVISFIFADLIAMPLLFVYRRYYGTRLTLRMLALFYVVMASAGLAVGGIFTGLGIVPARRSAPIAPAHFAWDATTYLNIVFLVVAGAVYWLYRRRGRFGGGRDYAVDPVCGMQVRISDAAATARRGNTTYWFCSPRCRDRFETSHAGSRSTHRN
ncbi:MAG TPA: permease [Acidimicrobiales bacterium]|nr:permease [Acidimicrobiales bacterium]